MPRSVDTKNHAADLAGSEPITAPHLLEAIQYRSLDRKLFY
jgi:magnesium chelatase family protein